MIQTLFGPTPSPFGQSFSPFGQSFSPFGPSLSKRSQPTVPEALRQAQGERSGWRGAGVN